MDLRSRALAAVDEGMSCRAAATRFGVAAATVIRWHDQRRSTGGYAAKPQGGEPTALGKVRYRHSYARKRPDRFPLHHDIRDCKVRCQKRS